MVSSESNDDISYTKILIKYILLHSIITSALCQYPISTGIKPDVTFGEENDRFDLASVIQDQNRFYNIDKMEYRRAEKQKHLLDALEGALESIRLKDSDFAYHDTMDSGGGSISDYEKNLKKFEKEAEEYKLKVTVDDLHDGQESGRRSNDPDLKSEILLHHAVPVQLNVKGYIQVPLDE